MTPKTKTRTKTACIFESKLAGGLKRVGKGIRRSQSGNQNEVRDAPGVLFARLRFCPSRLNYLAGKFSSLAGIQDATVPPPGSRTLLGSRWFSAKDCLSCLVI